MATVRLPPVLRSAIGGSKQVSAEGNTLGEVLADLYKRFPALEEQIQPEGNLSRFVNVYINDQDVRHPTNRISCGCFCGLHGPQTMC